MSELETLRESILSQVKEYSRLSKKCSIKPGEDYIPASGKVIDEDDLAAVVDASLDMWFTTGRYAKSFEDQFSKKMGHKYCLIVNSGSSANLVALSALTSPQLGDKRLKAGDEVITVAAGFPTTVNPIVQVGAIPVFLDVELETLQINVNLLQTALTSKTKAVVIAHTLGNVFDLGVIKEFCDKHNLWLVEDCCDAVGAEYIGKTVGTFGHIATVSFYPAHHITMGEGGAVLTSDPHLKRYAESFRDWGRDCWCPTGKDNSCKKRFDWSLGDLPPGYDHKYIYTHIGYNLKVTDMQAALGWSQLKKLDQFIEKRRSNFAILRELFEEFTKYLILPESTANSKPSWFGFTITLRDGVPFTRNDLRNYFEKSKIGTRMLFAGNLVRQPLYHPSQYRIVGDLKNTDKIMNDTFWIGLYPELDENHFLYVAKTMREFLKENGL